MDRVSQCRTILSVFSSVQSRRVPSPVELPAPTCHGSFSPPFCLVETGVLGSLRVVQTELHVHGRVPTLSDSFPVASVTLAVLPSEPRLFFVSHLPLLLRPSCPGLVSPGPATRPLDWVSVTSFVTPSELRFVPVHSSPFLYYPRLPEERDSFLRIRYQSTILGHKYHL